MTKIVQKKGVQYGLVYILFLIVLIKVKITGGDDELYRSIIHQRNFFAWLIDLYMQWSGRVVLTGLLALILNMPILLWKFLTAGVLTLFVYLIEKMTQESFYVRWIAFALILLIPTPILNSSAFWITGSLNYLWAFVAMAYVLSTIQTIALDKFIPRYVWVLTYAASILAANNEQTGLIISVFIGLVTLFRTVKDRKLDFNLGALAVFIIANFAFLMVAPGNYLRFQSEMISLKPNFMMYDLFDKLVIGFNYTFEVLFNQFKTVLVILTVLSIFMTRKDRIWVRIFAWYGLVYILFKIVMDYVIVTYPFCTDCNNAHYFLFTFKYLDLNFNERLMLYLPIMLSLSFILSVGLVIFHHVSDCFENNIVFSLLWVGSILSSVILGFSPTIDASGNRIFFVMSMGIVMVITFIVGEVLRHKEDHWLLTVLVILLMYEALQMGFIYYNVFDFTVIY